MPLLTVTQVTTDATAKDIFKGESYPFGALVDFMPQNDMKLEPMANKTIQGVFIGDHAPCWRVLRSGDYIVADYAPFKNAMRPQPR